MDFETEDLNAQEEEREQLRRLLEGNNGEVNTDDGTKALGFVLDMQNETQKKDKTAKAKRRT